MATSSENSYKYFLKPTPTMAFSKAICKIKIKRKTKFSLKLFQYEKKCCFWIRAGQGLVDRQPMRWLETSPTASWASANPQWFGSGSPSSQYWF
jgi:hypothetical protein